MYTNMDKNMDYNVCRGSHLWTYFQVQVGEEGFCDSPAPDGAALAGEEAAEETGVAASRALKL